MFGFTKSKIIKIKINIKNHIFHAAEPWSTNSIADGTVVTGQNPASAKGVGEKMVALVNAKRA